MNSFTSTMSSRRGCFFCTLSAILLFILLAIYLMVWSILAITAKNPNVQVDSASLDTFTLTNTTKLTAEWKIKLSVSNPNHHMRISYRDAFHGDLFYRDQQGLLIFLNTSTLQSFFNGSNVVQMRLKVDTNVGLKVAEDIDQSRRKYGMLEFGLTLSTWIRFKSDFFIFPRSHFENCYPVRFEISQNVYNTTIPGTLLQGV